MLEGGVIFDADRKRKSARKWSLQSKDFISGELLR
jgi:hypothetical protein